MPSESPFFYLFMYFFWASLHRYSIIILLQENLSQFADDFSLETER